jgi:hypothetical protein
MYEASDRLLPLYINSIQRFGDPHEWPWSPLGIGEGRGSILHSITEVDHAFGGIVESAERLGARFDSLSLTTHQKLNSWADTRGVRSYTAGRRPSSNSTSRPTNCAPQSSSSLNQQPRGGNNPGKKRRGFDGEEPKDPTKKLKVTDSSSKEYYCYIYKQLLDSESTRTSKTSLNHPCAKKRFDSFKAAR